MAQRRGHRPPATGRTPDAVAKAVGDADRLLVARLAIRLGLSNGRLEGLSSKIHLISHRAFGFPSPDPLIALVYVCCAGITIKLRR